MDCKTQLKKRIFTDRTKRFEISLTINLQNIGPRSRVVDLIEGFTSQTLYRWCTEILWFGKRVLALGISLFSTFNYRAASNLHVFFVVFEMCLPTALFFFCIQASQIYMYAEGIAKPVTDFYFAVPLNVLIVERFFNDLL